MQQPLLMTPAANTSQGSNTQICSQWKNSSILEGFLCTVYFLIEEWWVQQRLFPLPSLPVLSRPCRWDCAPVWSLQLEVTFLSLHRSRHREGSASHKTFVSPYAAGSLMSPTGVEWGENPTRSCLFKYCLWLQFSADYSTKIQVSVEDKKIIHFHLENKAEQRSFFQLF